MASRAGTMQGCWAEVRRHHVRRALSPSPPFFSSAILQLLSLSSQLLTQPPEQTMSSQSYFSKIQGPIPYSGPSSSDPLSFQWYNKDAIVHGRKMRDWLRFSVCFWHTFRGIGADPFGAATLARPWDTVDLAGASFAELAASCKRRVDAAFEFFSKLGVDYYTFHDRDVAPELDTIEQTNALLDVVADYLLQKQSETGIKLLWGTANLFSSPKFMNGAATNPDVVVYAHAAAQVKKAMEVTHKLGGEGYVFWGGREGYQSLLNTNVKKELDQMASFFHMAVAHKQKIGAKFQFYIEPKPREPTKHQYDYDAQTVIGFLYHYGLIEHFKLNIEPNHTTLAGHQYDHDIVLAAAYNMLGSIDCNTGDELLGWDTDQFLTDERKATLVLKAVIEMGGFKTGGLNFDCKVRRESTDIEDMFIAHIGSMDTFARGLLNAAQIVESGRLRGMIDHRYKSWTEHREGQAVTAGQSSFEELEQLAKKHGQPELRSGKQELFERVFNDELTKSSSKH
ncbi:xylose isomerase-like protein [Polychytrium aggregatum]|uniref:xylose isomerase-like protein n=1 Tax=Polychytrium aggregatum TaxID=110093 RepID=UPI0022FE98C4|nr:xylose isomerase-like protein [Polychytrium aggregatum]KAI9203283.1 xylose isomerase-like protein [Polychytrium aggregatum]